MTFPSRSIMRFRLGGASSGGPRRTGLSEQNELRNRNRPGDGPKQGWPDEVSVSDANTHKRDDDLDETPLDQRN